MERLRRRDWRPNHHTILLEELERSERLKKIVPDSFDLNTSVANYARAFQTTFREYLLQSGQYVDYAFYTRFERGSKRNCTYEIIITLPEDMEPLSGDQWSDLMYIFMNSPPEGEIIIEVGYLTPSFYEKIVEMIRDYCLEREIIVPDDKVYIESQRGTYKVILPDKIRRSHIDVLARYVSSLVSDYLRTEKLVSKDTLN